MSWHVPDGEELDFALEIFKEIAESTLNKLEKLLGPGTCGNGRSVRLVRRSIMPDIPRDSLWRNDFCRSVIGFWFLS